MDVLECIKTRRTIRKFKDEFVPWDKLVAVVEAARYAPTAGNLQNWKLVLIKEDAAKAKIAKACVEQKWIAQAAFVLIVVGEPKSAERFFGARANFYTVQNCAAVMQNMLLMAHSVGLGAAWVGAFDEEMIRDVINHAEYNHVQGVVALGIPDEHPQIPLRNRLEGMIYFGRWFARRRFAPYGWQSLNIPDAVQHTKKYVQRWSDKFKKKSEEWSNKFGKKEEEKPHHEQNDAAKHPPSHGPQAAPATTPSYHQSHGPHDEIGEFPPLESDWYYVPKEQVAPPKKEDHNAHGHH